MEISHRLENNLSVLALDGELTAGAVETFQKYIEPFLNDASLKGVVINLSHLNSISSSGVSTLVSACKDLRQRDAGFAVCELSPRHQSLFYTMGLDKVFGVYETEAEALDKCTEF